MNVKNRSSDREVSD